LLTPSSLRRHLCSVFLGASLLFALPLATPVQALEIVPAYPPLPTGYSSIRVFDRHGQFVGRILPDRRYWVSIDRIPLFLQQAVVAVEDARFYEHGGIDVRGIARALMKDVVKGRLAEGGSTITQQLIKNKYLTGEKSLDRKVKEGFLALDFEKNYTKKQILEMYFNEIYYGNGAWGIAQAARLYFDKSPEELNEAECAVLAGVQKNPGRYNPLGKPADVAIRRGVVLTRMADLKMISPDQLKKLRANPPTVVPAGQALQYLGQIRTRLSELYGPQIIDQGGLEVTAALDLNLQKLAEKALREGVRKINPQLQGALVALEPMTGDLLAVVGGVDNKQDSYNRALVARRQPGSSMKPLIYAAALEKGITAGSLWDDTPVSYDRGTNEPWRPQNYGGERHGEISLRQALVHSNNVIAVKLLENIGVPYAVEYAGKMGLNLLNRNDLSLALGTEEVTLHDLVLAYSPLANGGERSVSRTILRIFERNRRLWTENPVVVAPAISPAAAFITTQMLKDVLVSGTARSLKKFSLERPVAGKTGTTNDYRDAWFVGYTPRVVTGVWVGYDKPRPGGKGFTGGAIAAPIWERFMRPALKGEPVSDFPKPESVISVVIDPVSGYLATPECPQRREEFYMAGTQPTTYCPKHGGEKFTPPADSSLSLPSFPE
jgi:penicillin-binding protein 2D